MTFKAGDRVRLVNGFVEESQAFQTGILFEDCLDLAIAFDSPKAWGWTISRDTSEEHAGKRGWYVLDGDIEKVKDEGITLGVPQSIADDLKLPPQTRKVLAHLEAGKSISPLEAQNVYGIYRLAGRIHELRRAGYKVIMERREDEMGHKYGRYSLAS